MKIGSIVKRKDGRELRSGSSAYGAAIVVSLEPFILVSEHADMRWSATVKKEEFEAISEASPELLQTAMNRLLD
jgi:hypothetical protein